MQAFGVVALFVMAMVDPVWFGASMTGIALVPEPLWILIGAVVTFYFGSRHTEKRLAIGAAKHVASVAARVPQMVEAIKPEGNVALME